MHKLIRTGGAAECSPPCHGGGRGFESRSVRQEKRVTICDSFFLILQGRDVYSFQSKCHLGSVAQLAAIIIFEFAKPTESRGRYATLAQLVEQLIRNEQVTGSIPVGGSNTSSSAFLAGELVYELNGIEPEWLKATVR